MKHSMEFIRKIQRGVDMIDGQTSIFDNEPDVIEHEVEKKDIRPRVTKNKAMELTDDEKKFILSFIDYYSGNLIKWYVDENNQDTVRDFINNIKVKLGDEFLNRCGVKVNTDIKDVRNLIKGIYNK